MHLAIWVMPIVFCFTIIWLLRFWNFKWHKPANACHLAIKILEHSETAFCFSWGDFVMQVS